MLIPFPKNEVNLIAQQPLFSAYLTCTVIKYNILIIHIFFSVRECSYFFPSFTAQRDFPATPGWETQKKLGMRGPVRILIRNTTVIIISMQGSKIAQWEVKDLRKFGYTEEDFRVEVGRNCDFGPGTFTFMTNQV